ncbi:4Fe-4S dicluster domain-containing protein [Fusibacter sp. JL298sf-3]
MKVAKGKVTFNEDKCKGCALCTTACPVKIIKMDTSKINKKGFHPASVADMDKCIGCANCAMICPDTVITVERI